MLEMLSVPFMRQAFMAGLLSAAILGYLGVHVVKRRIVFVDLAIAQLSAVGVALAMLLDQEPVRFSLGFTLFGAALLSLPAYEKRIPQEAVMGIVYAVASAMAILLISKMPHGEADILNLFFGNILAVTTEQIVLIGLIAVSVAGVHAMFFRSVLPSGSVSTGRSAFQFKTFGLNLLFYLTLALVIAVAIRIAGVLLVFSYLVIPAVAAILFAERLIVMVFLSVGFGVAANWTGLFVSYRFDLPTGPTIVVVLGGGLGLAVLCKGLFKGLEKLKSSVMD